MTEDSTPLQNNMKQRTKIRLFIGIILVCLSPSLRGQSKSILDHIEPSRKAMLLENIRRMPYNSRRADLSPVFFEDGVVYFLSRRVSRWEWMGKEVALDGLAYAKIYCSKNAKIANPLLYAPFVPFHIEYISFSPDFKFLYYTQTGENYPVPMYSSYEESVIEDSKWNLKGRPLKITDVDSTAFVGHPRLSEDGEYLFFVSDDLSGEMQYRRKGRLHPYYSRKISPGEWDSPQRVDLTTPHNVITPYYCNGFLYYASDPQRRKNGFDLFRVEYDLVTNQALGKSEALDALNTKADEFGFVYDPEHQKALFVSNRAKRDTSFTPDPEDYDVYACEAFEVYKLPGLEDKGHPFADYYVLAIFEDGYKNGKNAIPGLDTQVYDFMEVLYQNYVISPDNMFVMDRPEKREIIEMLSALRHKLHRHNNLLLLYSGHGEEFKIEEDSSIYGWGPSDFIPQDSIPLDSNNLVTFPCVMGLINDIPARHKFIINDCCHGGGLFGEPGDKGECYATPENLKVPEEVADSILNQWQYISMAPPNTQVAGSMNCQSPRVLDNFYKKPSLQLFAPVPGVSDYRPKPTNPYNFLTALTWALKEDPCPIGFSADRFTDKVTARLSANGMIEISPVWVGNSDHRFLFMRRTPYNNFLFHFPQLNTMN